MADGDTPKGTGTTATLAGLGIGTLVVALAGQAVAGIPDEMGRNVVAWAGPAVGLFARQAWIYVATAATRWGDIRELEKERAKAVLARDQRFSNPHSSEAEKEAAQKCLEGLDELIHEWRRRKGLNIGMRLLPPRAPPEQPSNSVAKPKRPPKPKGLGGAAGPA